MKRFIPWPRMVWGLFLGSLLSALCAPGAWALPAYARQTGQNCVACHVSFPELTPYGRLFKLTGYTIGQHDIPLAFMAQGGAQKIRNNTDANGNSVMVRNDDFAFSAASLFIAGKITDNAGLFGQWTSTNLVADPASGNLRWQPGSDNTDLRIVGSQADENLTDLKWIYGLTVHNNPTVQDVWNSSPAWYFPFTVPPGLVSPSAHTLIEGGLAQQVAGIGGYVFYDKTIYAEFTAYKTADGVFSVFREGHYQGQPGDVSALKGGNPYVRLAYNHEWGAQSLELGGFAFQADVYPDDTLQYTPTDRFRDVGLDAQYQYITQQHTFTTQASVIHENQNYRASYPATLAGMPIGVGPTPANPSDTLTSTRWKGSYYYERKYGVTLGLFDIRGSSDMGLYGPGTVSGSGSGSPNSRGAILELDYMPIQNLRVMLQYTAYTKFNGATNNYDGFGRSASDNNTLFLNLWTAF